MGAAGASLLQACAPAAPSAPAAGGGAPAAGGTGGVKLPTYVPFEGPKPDLAGNPQGLDPAYFKFPKDLVKTITTPPGDGSTISAITYLTLAPPPPMEENAAWQAINKSINATLKMDQVTAADYPAKVNVVVAGNDLPDFIYNPTTTQPSGVISGLPQFVKARCADLTPYLSGDAIKEYPNLAHYSAYTWRSGVVEGKIYALPIARPPIGSAMMYRHDLFEKVGITIDKAPKDADEFKRMLVAVNRPQENQYAMATGTAKFGLPPNGFMGGIFRVPNNWRLDSGGKLVKDFESQEWKAQVGFMRDLWSAGVMHPNSPTYAGAFNDDFMAGRFAVGPSVWGAYVQLWDVEAVRNQAAKIYPMHPFAHDGGKVQYNAGSGNFGITYIRQQSSPDRLKMLLRVANFFAAPFGSQEWLLNYFGVKDTDFSFNAEGAPVLTDQGRLELTAVWRYVSSPAYALFSAYRSQEFAQVSYAAEQAMIAAMEVDPTLGLHSPTAAGQGQLAQDALIAGAAEIVLSRRPLSDLDGLVAEWRQNVGDKIRGEFQDALAAAAKA
jgi:putative aldouronate transport system substrate-binding protein